VGSGSSEQTTLKIMCKLITWQGTTSGAGTAYPSEHLSSPLFLVGFVWINLIWFDLLCLTPLSAIFQLYHGDQF
jgi:hypothetical protein